MLVFVDETGDPGMKASSSSHFIVVAVWFEDREEAQACDTRIGTIKTELNIPMATEFHFCKCSSRVRTYFLQETAKFQWFFYAIVIDKKQLDGTTFQVTGSFYKYSIGLLVQSVKPYLNDAIVILDKCGNKAFRSQLAQYLNHRTNEHGDKAIKKTKLQDSRTNHLIQLSDMVCGSVGRLYRDRKNPDEYYKLIRHRKLELKVWPS